MSEPLLRKWFPWAQSPTICNGPMMNVASPALATEVSKAGGIGFLPCIMDVSVDSSQLASLDSNLAESERLLGGGDALHVGAGFLTGHASITKFSQTVLPVLEKYSPAAVWLFAPDGSAGAAKPHSEIIQALRTLSTPPKVFVQVGNVAAAREALNDGADVLVCQGIDAGGHQFKQGSGVVTLVPEVRAMLEAEAPGREIAVIAAGGIVNGRGVAAALALGADGFVMGTRFTVSHESEFSQSRKDHVLKTVDGGVSTLKSPFNDEIHSSDYWSPIYDGRAIIGPIHEQFLAGASLEECKKKLNGETAINTWAGTGVGLVKKAQPAGEIVREVQAETKAIIKNLTV